MRTVTTVAWIQGMRFVTTDVVLIMHELIHHFTTPSVSSDFESIDSSRGRGLRYEQGRCEIPVWCVCQCQVILNGVYAPFQISPSVHFLSKHDCPPVPVELQSLARWSIPYSVGSRPMLHTYRSMNACVGGLSLGAFGFQSSFNFIVIYLINWSI